MLRNSLLTVHLLSVIVWLGCGLYELFLAREMRKARGTTREVDLARLYLKYAAPVPTATILVLVTGVWMAIAMEHWFFQSLWLGLKQALMISVMIVFASVLPPFFRLQKEVEQLPRDASSLSAEAVRSFSTLEPWLIAMRTAGTIAVVLAVWRPSFS